VKTPQSRWGPCLHCGATGWWTPSTHIGPRPEHDHDRPQGGQCRRARIFIEITEADEAATSKDVALANLREQVAKGETQGVIDMYERAAWYAGATVSDTEDIIVSPKHAGRR